MVLIAPPLPAHAQVVILARAWMGPHSTPSIALAGQRYVILSMACSATHPTVNVHLLPFQIVSRQMVQQLTERRARAESQNVRQPPVFSVTHPKVNVHLLPFQIVSQQMAQQ